ncbi:hypothetical protein [Methylobacter sp.]|uniref:hypothetical protein n=1 Tax=Methylobacter sp. TaxID=2051955 RepID=UPI0011F9C75B|nr:hypothetical protein [Methylobacter sp.]TAK59480.1 MAG: hypothetical protein EPO18_20165 [Methylobacter sp.]
MIPIWGIWSVRSKCFISISCSATDPNFHGSHLFGSETPWDSKEKAQKFLDENKKAFKARYGEVKVKARRSL